MLPTERIIIISLAVLSLSSGAARAEDKARYERGFNVALPGITAPGQPERIGDTKCAKSCKKEIPGVKMTVTIHAAPKYVWQAIQSVRSSDGGKRKLVSYDGHNAVIEEKFGALPIVGAATCTYTEHESVPNERIDYEILRSDRFNAFQGHWVLHPAKDGASCTVELTNELDPGIRVPFWQDITRMAAMKNVKHRLEEVTSIAETMQKRETVKDARPDSVKTSALESDAGILQ